MPVTTRHDRSDARVALGRRLAELRKAAGLTQHSLAPLTLYGRSTVANVELGRQSVARDFWVRCDRALGTGGALTADYDQIHARRAQPVAAGGPPRQAEQAPATTGELVRADEVSLLDAGRAPDLLALGQRQVLWAPPGRFFSGIGIDVEVHAATQHDRVLVAVPDHYASAPFLAAPGCGLVLGRTGDGHVFGLDRRHARHRLRHAVTGARLPMPSAYRLDELTCSLLWAVANLDQALLADDGLLADCQDDVTGYERLPRSAVSRDVAADLSPVGRMWLGSTFCAGHIGRHAGQLRDAPVFWTRERRGEEASGWLLFTHKHDYLKTSAARLGDARAVRAFCVPRSQVDVSPLPERILLLLAAALIESYGIEVAVTDAPEYTATAGFVTDRRTAVVANWIDADGIWHVDVTDHRPTVREYTDAVDDADHRSVIRGVTAAARLRALADYLGVDWPWLVGRCRDLAAYGTAGIAQPRSRHLSVAGVDRACTFLAACATAGTAG
jgi:transcriptional regulator with XRE-family HTH domain